MADPLCKFFDARSITGSQFFATYFSAHKPFLLLPLVSLHNPTHIRRRGRRKSLHIAFCSTPTSSNLDVISTHENSDGSLLFRFGNPSEVAKEDELEEPLLGVEEVERDNEEEFSVVKVMDGDNEREVIVKKLEREANKSNGFVERETGLNETFLEDFKDDIASISSLGIQDQSDAEVNVEILEKKDDSEASVPPAENSIPSLEVEEEMKGQASDESFEELVDDNSPLLGSPEAMLEYSDSVNAKEMEESEGEGLSQLRESDGDKDFHEDSTRSMENGEVSTEIEAAVDDIEIAQRTEQTSEHVDIMEEPVESAQEGINLGNTETVFDEISPENAPEGINLGNTRTVADEISLEIDPEAINPGNTETIVDEIGPENDPEAINPGNTETVVGKISPENAPEEINPGNTETVLDEISPENDPEEINPGKTETIVDEISPENDPKAINPGNTETVVHGISPENVPEGINLGNTETVVDEISPENTDIRRLSMDAEVQSTEVLDSENDDQTELINVSADTEDQASQNDTFKDSGETNVIEAIHPSPKLEAEPILDEEVDHNLISESNEYESPLPPDEKSPSLSLEEKRKEDIGNSEIMEVSGHEVVEDTSSEVLDSSKEATPAELILSSGATLLQYTSKALAGGHEAYFVARGKWLGVADGVGSWSLEGSDLGVYAQELMENSEFIVSQCYEDLINDPKQVLKLSVSATDSPGSSTVLIAHFDGKALHVANIGDSGFIVITNGSVYRKSSPMIHEFNFPIQIEKGDDPSQLLEEYKIELDEGDIIVTATDALFDNLYDQEIVSIVSRSLEADKSPQEIAEILATRVQEVGSSASGRSPFADAAQAAGYVGYTGGKRDDVVVIVSVVQKVNISNDN
ncbi:hypothetical protein K7X08_009046 [Anisodus acutangulus]|uniref:PPM-type phosphatase domain-containing protein n=1 Tax=Anisodus acutangulus TaxID=402998 RepID=A0A9Q1MZ22_9SOLA|nr:hypothetical protein K7X08_009046 [Anisodus acutangulus]